MPDGGDDWYTDAEGVDDGRYESFFISEFIPYIDNQLSTIPDRRGRGIAGNSMGDYGAIKFALKYPHLFSFAGSMSGVLDVARKTEENPGPGWDDLKSSILKVFGRIGNKTRSDNDVLKIIRDRVQKPDADMPYLYLDCGVDDHYLGANRSFAKELQGTTVDHVFHELLGGHDWEYWNERVRHLLGIAECMLVKLRNLHQAVS